MNRIHRVVFNRSLGVMQVASELTRRTSGGADGGGSARSGPGLLALALGTGLLLTGGSAWAQAAIQVPLGETHTISGTIVGGGTINGTLNASLWTNVGELTNNGTLTSSGQFLNGNPNDLSQVSVLNNASVMNNAGTMFNLRTLNNSGTLANTGSLQSSGTLTNTGTLDNADHLTGHINNNGSGVVVFSGAGAQIYGDVISGTGRFIKRNAGTTTLNGANTYTGSTTVEGGMLDITGSVASTQVNVQGGSLRVDGSSLADAAAVNLTGTGNFTLTGSETIGSLAGTANTTVTLGAHTLTTGGNGGSTTMAGAISGNGGLVKQGGGTFTLSGTNTYYGGTTVNAGTLGLASAGALAPRAGSSIVDPDLIVNNAGIVLASASNALAVGFQVFNDTSRLNASAAQAISGGNQAFFFDSQLNASAAQAISGGTQTFSANSRLNASVAQAIQGGDQRFYGNSQLNASAAQAIGGGAQVFYGSSRLNASAGQAISTGTQNFREDSGLNASAVQAVSGGTQTFVQFSQLNASVTGAVDGGVQQLRQEASVQVGAVNALTRNASLNFGYADYSLETGGTLQLNGNSTVVGALNSGTDHGPGAGLVRNNGTAAATLTVDSSVRGDSIFSGRIIDSDTSGKGSSAALGLVKEGAGTFTLSGTGNTYTGTTTVKAGTLDITGSIGSAQANVEGGTLRVDGASLADTAVVNLTGTGNFDLTGSETIGSLAGTANTTVTLGAHTLTTGGNDSNTTMAGAISGTGRLIKQGTGTFTLLGSNTYTGGTIVNAGTLELASAGSLAPRTGSTAFAPDLIVNNASVALASASNALTVGFQVFNDASQLNASAAQAISGGTQNFLGVSQLNASTARAISGGVQNFYGPTRLSASAGQAISAGAQNFFESSRLVASAAQAVSGGTQTFVHQSQLNASVTGAVDGGTQQLLDDALVLVGAADALTRNASLNFGYMQSSGETGGRLHLNGHSTVVGALNSGTDHGPGAGLVRNNGSAPVTLTVDSSVRGDSSFSGRIIDSDNGASGTLALVKEGAGTFTLSGTNSYTGGTTVNGGTLELASAGALAVRPGGSAGAPDLVVNNAGIVQASAGNAIAGGFQGFENTSQLNAVASQAISGGSQFFFSASQLNASVAQAINGGNQYFYEGGQLNALVGEAIAGGTQYLYGNSRLNASAAGAVDGGWQVLSEEGSVQVGAINALTRNVRLNFLYGASSSETGGILQLNGHSTVVGALNSGTHLGSGAGLVRNNGTGPATLTVDSSVRGDSAFSGRIIDSDNTQTGTLALAKEGAGTFTLSGTGNTYTGTTTVKAGMLDITGSISSAQVNVEGGTLRVDGASLADTAAVNLSGTGIFTLTGSETIGSLAGVAGTTVTLGAHTLTTGGNGGSTTMAGGISGTGGLVKEGSGTFTLSGTNTYIGGTTVNGGSLALASASALPQTESSDGLSPPGLTASNQGAVTATVSDALHAGYQWFLGDSQLHAQAENAISGGLQAFTNQSQLNASQPNALSGGQQHFLGSTRLNASASQAVSGGAQLFLGDSQLRAQAAGAVDGGVQNLRQGASIQVEAVNALTRNAQLSFSFWSLGDAQSGSLQLNGHSTTVGALRSGVADAGLIRNNASGPATLTVDSGALGDSAFSGRIIDSDNGASGTLALAKEGAGTFTLSGTGNTYTGSTTVKAGMLDITGSISSAQVNVEGGRLRVDGASLADTSAVHLSGTGNFDLTGSETIGSLAGTAGSTVTLGAHTLTTGGNGGSTTLAGTIFGSGGLAKEGTGTLTLTGHNSGFTGLTTVRAGTLAVNGLLGGTVQVNSGATLGGTGTLGGNVTVAGTLSPGNSPGTLTVQGDLTLAAGSTSVFELGQAGTPGGAANDLVNVGGSLTLGGSLQATAASAGWYRLFNYGMNDGTGTLSGSFDAASSVVRIGTDPATSYQISSTAAAAGTPGEVNLSVVGAGQTLQFWRGPNSAPGSSVDGGTGIWNISGTNWAAADMTGAPDGNSAVSWANSVGVFQGSAGTVTVQGPQLFDTLQFSTTGYTLAAHADAGSALHIAPTAGGFINTATADVATRIEVPIHDGEGNSLTKVGEGTLTLAGSNGYTGTTRVNEGTLVAAHNNALGTSAGGTTVASGATLGLQGGITTSEPLTLSGNGVAHGGALRNLSGINEVMGAITLQGDTRITSDAGHLNLRGSISGTDTHLTVGGSADVSVYGAIATGEGGLTKDGLATLTLNGANSYTGATTVNAGALAIYGGSALPDSAMLTVQAGAMVQVGASETVGNIQGGGNISLYYNSTLTAGDATPLSVFSGGIFEEGTAGSFVKQGSGTLELSGFSNYKGSTLVNAGTLALTGDGRLASTASIDIANGATLSTDGGALTGGAPITNAGTFALTAGGTETVSRLNGTGQVQLSLGSVLTLNTGTSDLEGIVSGEGGLTIDASSETDLRASNTYTGSTTVTGGGVLRLYNGSAIADSGAVVLNGGTLQLEASETIGSLAGSNSHVHLQDHTLTTGGNDATTGYGGMLTGNTASRLVKTGSGTLTLSGPITTLGGMTVEAGTLALDNNVNTIMGGITVDAGRLRLGADGAAGGVYGQITTTGSVIEYANGVHNATPIRIDSNTTQLEVLGTDAATQSGAISELNGPRGFEKTGTGTLTLSGSHSYTGTTTVAGGTLRAGAVDSFSAASAMNVQSGATLDLGGFNQTVAGMTLANAGTVNLRSATPGTVLTVTGPWVGEGGTLAVGTTLGDSSSATDRVLLVGTNAVASGTTNVSVQNMLGGLGALTTGSGIEVVGTREGASIEANAFVMATAVQAGAYEYRLNSTSDGAYLVSHSTTPPPPPPPPPPAPPPAPEPPAPQPPAPQPPAPQPPAPQPPAPQPPAPQPPAPQPPAPQPPAPQPPAPQPPAPPPAPEPPAPQPPAPPPAPEPPPAPPAPPAPAPVSVPLYRAEVPLYAALPEQLREANLGMLGTLHQRQGDTVSTGTEGGQRQAWGRVITLERDIAQGGTTSPHSQGRLTGFQAGTDLWADANVRAGVYVGQLDGDMKVSGFARGVAGYAAGRNDLKNQYLGGYATWRHDTGLYVDGVLQAGRHRADVRAYGAFGSQAKGHSLLASLEVGKAFAIAPGWSVEPQLQLVHQRLSLDDTAISGATTVQQDADSGWAVRAGVRVTGNVTTSAGVLQPYARLNLWHSAKGEDRTRFVGPAAFTDVFTRTGGSRTELAVGAQWQITPAVAAYGELGQLWGSGGSTKTKGGPSASLGVKVRW